MISAIRMTATTSSTVGGSAGYRRPLLRGGRSAWKPLSQCARSTSAAAPRPDSSGVLVGQRLGPGDRSARASARLSIACPNLTGRLGSRWCAYRQHRLVRLRRPMAVHRLRVRCTVVLHLHDHDPVRGRVTAYRALTASGRSDGQSSRETTTSSRNASPRGTRFSQTCVRSWARTSSHGPTPATSAS
jgi:hypothetical protein